MVGIPKRNQTGPARYFFDQFHGPFDGLSTGISEVNLVQGGAQKFMQQSRQPNLGVLHMFPVNHGMPIAVQLLGHCTMNDRMPMPHNAHRNPRNKIQVALAQVIVDVGALCPVHLQGHGPRRGWRDMLPEQVPQMAVLHRSKLSACYGWGV